MAVRPLTSLVDSARERAAFLRRVPAEASVLLGSLWRVRSSGILRNPVRPVPWPSMRFALAVTACDVPRFCALAVGAKARARMAELLREEETQPGFVLGGAS